MARKDKCFACQLQTKCKGCTCGAYFCPDHLPEDKHDHAGILVLKAKQSKIGRSNVRRSKGHERTIAKFLTDWSGQEFRRRRVEGRDVTVIERESTADVIPVKGDIHCSIEAKCGEIQTFGNLMANPKTCKFTEWWHQSNYDVKLVSEILGRQFYPMMFFRPYIGQNWVAVSCTLFEKGILRPREGDALTEWQKTFVEGGSYKIWFPHFLFDAYDRVGEISFNVVRTKEKKNFRFVPLKLDSMVICRWQNFAACVDPQSFFLTPITPPQNYKGPSEETDDGVSSVREDDCDESGEGDNLTSTVTTPETDSPRSDS